MIANYLNQETYFQTFTEFCPFPAKQILEILKL